VTSEQAFRSESEDPVRHIPEFTIGQTRKFDLILTGLVNMHIPGFVGISPKHRPKHMVLAISVESDEIIAFEPEA
jgi:hypothetical protein